MVTTKTPDRTTVRLEFYGANYELLTNTSKECLISGPAGTGKTQAALTKLHLLCMRVPGLSCLVLRKTQVALVGSTMKTYKYKVAAEALKFNYVKYYGGSGSEPAAYRYWNGSAIMVGGLDRREKYLSMEFDLILVDEAIETDSEDLDILVTRLRNGKLAYQQMILLTNPGAPTHHLKIRADTGRCAILYGQHKDNPAYWDRVAQQWTPLGRDYLDRLDGLPTVRRQRFLLGQWVAAEGLIYDEFDPAVHLCDPFPGGNPPKEWDRFITVDFGFNNPFVAMWIAVSPDDRMYVYRELYQTGLLVEDAARLMRGHIERDSAPPSKIVCDHDAEDRATLERHLQRATIAAKKDVLTGIQAVQARLRKDAKGDPRLFICRGSLIRPDGALRAARRPTCLEEEVPTYVWDQRSQPGTENLREAPVKQDDHSCLVAGTQVTTARGDVPIEQVQFGDMVATRQGWRSVAVSGMTDSLAKVFRVDLSDGTSLTGTGNHPVWVQGHGWVRLDSLRYADILESWKTNSLASRPSSSTASGSGVTRGLSAGPENVDNVHDIGRLHEEIWKEANGPVPAGCEIHHADFDPLNNDVDNLVCLTVHKHKEAHAERGRARSQSAEAQAHLERIRPLAAEWHRSPEGIAWHREHAAAQGFGQAEFRDGICDNCRRPYRTSKPGGNDRFCSNACKSAWRRAHGLDDEQRTCANCGCEFTVNKYSKTHCCTRECAQRYRRNHEGAGLQPGG